MAPSRLPVLRLAGHAVHWALDVARVPAQKVSTGHSLQAVSPLPSWYWPAGHSVQFSCRVLLLNWPNSHVLHSAAPTPDRLPTSHGRQTDRFAA